MGLRGPPKTPTKILKNRGSWLVNERKGEPTPEEITPICPRWISREAKLIWKGIVPKLEKMRVLTTVDRNTLTTYCVLRARWKMYEKFLAENTMVYPVKNDAGDAIDFKIWPQAKEAKALSQQLLRIEQQFGMTPASRAGLTVNKTTERNDDRSRWLNKTRQNPAS